MEAFVPVLQIRREPPKFLDPNKDPYEGYDLTPLSSEEEGEMADISQIDDEEVLHKMVRCHGDSTSLVKDGMSVSVYSLVAMHSSVPGIS